LACRNACQAFFVDNEESTLMADDAEERINRLQKQYHDLAELAGSLAHEIKNPLSVIRMNMDMLAEDLAESDTPENRRLAERTAMVQKQCTRLENLLKDFLKLAGLNKMQLESGSLNQQVEQVLGFYEFEAKRRNVDIVRYLDPDLPSMLMDRQPLQAALLNLIKNALEAMPDGGQLVARTRITPNGIALDLIDTGKGIDDTTMMNMFSAFYTTKDGGSGLGLPTAKKIIEAHGGRIKVQSAVDRGTQFTLEFPTPKRI
jgi:signal transduction histidine kinase